MGGGANVLAFQFELLEQFFSRAQAHEVNLDIAVRLQAGEADKVANQVQDSHRFAHIQDKDFSAFAHAGGLQHQLHRFRDGHEVAPRVGIGHCHRTAGGNLLFEQRQRTAVAAQHITEPHRHETGATVVQPLHDQFSNPLGDAHNVGGVYGLVGGDQHEILHVKLPRHQSDVIGAKNVVAD